MAKGRFAVRIIQAGLSANGNFYPDAVLRSATPLFEGCRVFAKGDREHIAGAGTDIRNLVGRITAAEFRAGATPDSGELIGQLELIDPESEIGRKVTKAAERGMLDLFGLSIDAAGSAEPGTIAGRRARIARSFERVHSVDLIVQPGAGGQVVNLIEAAGSTGMESRMDRNRIVQLIRDKRPEALQGKDPERMADTELAELLASLLDDKPVDAADRQGAMREAIDRSRLPAAAKQRLVAEFASRDRFTEADVTARIKDEAEYLVSVGVGGGHVHGLGGDPFIEAGEHRSTKVERMLDAFFDPNDSSVTSIRDVYVDITGDRRFTGQLRNCDRQRLTEALGTDTLDVVLGNAIHRRMVEEYRTADIYGLWRDMVTIVPVSDFRTQERVRYGGYGDIPVVAENAAYVAVTSPGDEKASYAVTKRGGLETISLEAITNDDVGAIQRVPVRLAQAAKRTLSRFVFDIPRTNPAIYDTKALFHADHGNLGSSALSAAAVAAARLLMKAQTERDSDAKLGIGPKFIWVPDELESTAFELFRRTTNQESDFVESLQLALRPVWCWTDANDWCLTADTRDVPFIELGFLGGNQEPELFVQDSPTSGSMFSHDRLTYKIRHIYGAAVTDYRGAFKSVVT